MVINRCLLPSNHAIPSTVTLILCTVHACLTFLSTKMAATFSVRPNGFSPGSPFRRPTGHGAPTAQAKSSTNSPKWRGVIFPTRRTLAGSPRAGSRADDSAPFEMSVENALKLLGVSDGASFEDILRAKNSILAACKDDQKAIAQVRDLFPVLAD